MNAKQPNKRTRHFTRDGPGSSGSLTPKALDLSAPILYAKRGRGLNDAVHLLAKFIEADLGLAPVLVREVLDLRRTAMLTPLTAP